MYNLNAVYIGRVAKESVSGVKTIKRPYLSQKYINVYKVYILNRVSGEVGGAVFFFIKSVVKYDFVSMLLFIMNIDGFVSVRITISNTRQL